MQHAFSMKKEKRKMNYLSFTNMAMSMLALSCEAYVLKNVLSCYMIRHSASLSVDELTIIVIHNQIPKDTMQIACQ